MDFSRFEALPLLGILRGVTAPMLAPLAEVVASAGLRAVEITMNTAGAAEKISELSGNASRRFLVGAGTVLSRSNLDEALAAGAEFIVMPMLEREVVRRCVDLGVPVLPGALTPQEVFEAARAGATLIKLFPASVFGPRYFKELRGPFSDVRLLACGGVNTANLDEYFTAGAVAAAVGGSIFRSDWLNAGEYPKIESALAALVGECRRIMARSCTDGEGARRSSKPSRTQ